MCDEKREQWTFIDLCAGIGGFHAAFKDLGGRCLGAWEIDQEARDVYKENWGIEPHGDLMAEDWEMFSETTEQVDVLAGGFPCQPFSKSGAQRGMEEARGTVFFGICRAIEALKPAVVMLENVRNLVGPRHTHEWEVIVRTLRELGYEVSDSPVILSPHWIPASSGGAPQNRERVFILATRRGDGEELEGPAWEKTIDLNKTSSSWDLARDLPLEVEDEIAADHLESLMLGAEERLWVDAWGDLIERLRSREIDIPTGPIWVDTWDSSFEITAGTPAWKEKIQRKNIAFYAASKELLDDWIEHSGVRGFPASRRKLEWQAGDAELEQCLVQMRPSGLRVKRATHTGALVAIDQRPIVVSRGRRLSIRECARLQGFPEWFEFKSVGPRAVFKQLGNAVHVGSVRYALQGHLSDPQVLRLLGEGSRLVEAVRHV